jgi:hypothetical protein
MRYWAMLTHSATKHKTVCRKNGKIIEEGLLSERGKNWFIAISIEVKKETVTIRKIKFRT